MTFGGMIGVWLSTLGLVALFTIGPVLLVEHSRSARTSEIVVIGTSLMEYAVPAIGGGVTSLLGDQRSHIRLAKGDMTESELLTQLDQAIDKRPALVLIEANPLLFDFAYQAYQRPCDGLFYSVWSFISGERHRVPKAYRQLLNGSGDPTDLESRHIINPVVTSRLYPIVLREPCETARLTAAVARAEAQSTRIVLILPPRSPDANRLLGTSIVGELRNRAIRLAVRVGAELFVVDGDWKNDEFLDSAHVNQIGREHFLRDLRRWWAKAQ